MGRAPMQSGRLAINASFVSAMAHAIINPLKRMTNLLDLS
jgi:hypothetical protein